MSKYPRITAAALMAVVLLSAGPGAGDAIPPGKAGCPPGTTGESDHHGQYCAASSCKAHKDCPQKRRCQPYALCVQEVTYGHPRGNTHRVKARGTCSKKAACPESSICQVARRCVPPGTPLPDITQQTAPGHSRTTPGGGAPQKQGCGSCSLGASPFEEGGLTVVLVVIVALALGRRRS